MGRVLLLRKNRKDEMRWKKERKKEKEKEACLGSKAL